MDNCYASPQPLELMDVSNNNLRAVGTCKANTVGFTLVLIKMNKKCKKGSYVRFVNKRSGMVIIGWKDSQILQVVSTVTESGIDLVQKRKVEILLDV